MFFANAHHWDVRRLLACLTVFILVFSANVQVYAATQWKRFEDPSTGLSLRYPFYWGLDLRKSGYDTELIATFLAPVTDNWVMKREPATVELRAVKTNSTESADIRGLADGFQRYYLDRPHMYRVFQREDTEVKGRSAVQFTYTMLGEDETRYITEVWQAVGNLAVSLRFSTYAQPNQREVHYAELFTGMADSLLSLHNEDSLIDTDNLQPLGGKLSTWAEPRLRSDIPDHELPRVFRMEGGMTVHYPEEWKAEPVYENLYSESVFFTEGRRNSLPFTVTVTDLYDVFIANVLEYTDRKRIVEMGDSIWLETVIAAQIANCEERVPEFELLRNTGMEVGGKPAVMLEYRGLNSSGERESRREVLMVDRRILYSFVYIPGTEATRTFEKMVGSVVLP